MIRFDLIRHGQPEWAPGGVFKQDSPLSQLGHKQAHRAGKLYESAGHVELFVSPLTRARETSLPVCVASGREATVLDWLQEIKMGGFEGLPAPEAEESWRGIKERGFEHWEQMGDLCEPFSDFRARVAAGMDRFLSGRLKVTHRMAAGHRIYDVPPQDRHIVFVIHGGTIGCIVSHLLGLPSAPWVWEQFRSGHGTVTTLESTSLAGGHIWSLVEFSKSNHLDGIEKTY